jgi:D-amino-acid dehydrogenase
MRTQQTVIIGGGLIGLATGFALVERGIPVRVIESLAAVGHGTSFANGGLVTPSMSEPWNEPGVARHFAAAFLDPAAPMKLRASALPGLVRWGVRFLRHSTPQRCRASAEASFRLAAVSVAATREWRERCALAYDGRASGALSVFRRGTSIDAQLTLSRHLQSLGLRFTQLDAAGAVALEPALGESAAGIVAALHVPDDEVGDGRALCAALAAAIIARGGSVELARCARRLVVQGGRIAGVDVGDDHLPARHVVVAAGVASVPLLRAAGVRIAVAPAKGYSLTVDLAGRAEPPRLPVSDAARHVVLTPLGQRLRIAGTAEFAGSDLRLRPERIAPLAAAMRELYPALARAADPAQGVPWTGLRPVSADGLPYIGATAIDGLYVNAGHGALGLTLAAGSGILLAQLLRGDPAAVDPAPYSPQRD